MTYEEALELINNYCVGCLHNDSCDECEYPVIFKALKKRIPMKPTRPDCYALHCPTCNNIVFDFNVERQDYCSKCGQAIDWSD